MAVDVSHADLGAVLAACRTPDVLGEVEVARVQIVLYRPATQGSAAWLSRRH